MRFDRNLAFLLLAIYLILAGLMGLGLSFGALNILVSLIALAAGILFILNR